METEEGKKECPEETAAKDEFKEEPDEISNKELESIETASHQIEENPIETTELENKEELSNAQNSQDNAEEIEKVTEEVNSDLNTDIENTEQTSDMPITNDEEKSQDGNSVVSFDNIKIKEEPMDDVSEQPESELFEFANVEIKEEPIDPDMGMYTYIVA